MSWTETAFGMAQADGSQFSLNLVLIIICFKRYLLFPMLRSLLIYVKFVNILEAQTSIGVQNYTFLLL